MLREIDHYDMTNNKEKFTEIEIHKYYENLLSSSKTRQLKLFKKDI